MSIKCINCGVVLNEMGQHELESSHGEAGVKIIRKKSFFADNIGLVAASKVREFALIPDNQSSLALQCSPDQNKVGNTNQKGQDAPRERSANIQV